MVEIEKITQEICDNGFDIKDFDYPTTSKKQLHFLVIRQKDTAYQMVICKEVMECLCKNPQYTETLILNNYIHPFKQKKVIPRVKPSIIQSLIRLKFANKLDNVFESSTSIDFGPIVLQAVILNDTKDTPDIITSEHLKQYGLSFKDCLKIGKNNMINDIMIQANEGSYIISNSTGNNDANASAAGILFADELFSYCNEKNKSLILIPSSIKEFIAVPIQREQITPDIVITLTNLLRNENISLGKDILANDLFYYDDVEESLFFGDKKYTLEEIKHIF